MVTYTAHGDPVLILIALAIGLLAGFHPRLDLELGGPQAG